jgi:hypothetical protein
MKVASAVTFDVFRDFVGCVAGLLGFGRVAGADEAVVGPGGAGVPERLGSALIVRSLPCVSMIAEGNSASFVSRAVGRRLLASSNKAVTAGVGSVVKVQVYCSGQRELIGYGDKGSPVMRGCLPDIQIIHRL